MVIVWFYTHVSQAPPHPLSEAPATYDWMPFNIYRVGQLKQRIIACTSDLLCR